MTIDAFVIGTGSSGFLLLLLLLLQGLSFLRPRRHDQWIYNTADEKSKKGLVLVRSLQISRAYGFVGLCDVGGVEFLLFVFIGENQMSH